MHHACLFPFHECLQQHKCCCCAFVVVIASFLWLWSTQQPRQLWVYDMWQMWSLPSAESMMAHD
jgi:hypothetical protein